MDKNEFNFSNLVKIISDEEYSKLLSPEYRELLDVVKRWLPMEYDRSWTMVELDGVLHTDSRCVVVDGFDNLHYNDRVHPEHIRNFTFYQMLSERNHCERCYKSFLVGGFNHGYLFSRYKSLVRLDRDIKEGLDCFESFFHVLVKSDFSFSDKGFLFFTLLESGLINFRGWGKLIYLNSSNYDKLIDKSSFYLVNNFYLVSFESNFSELNFEHIYLSGSERDFFLWGRSMNLAFLLDVREFFNIFTFLLKDAGVRFDLDGVNRNFDLAWYIR